MSDDLDLEQLADELSEFAASAREETRSPLEERVLAGFEEVQRWAAEHGHPPRHGEGLDIFERLYAVRLDRIRNQAELRSLVQPLDHQNLLADDPSRGTDATELSDDELAAELDGIGEGTADLTTLKHVRPRSEIEAAEEIANRKPCTDFETFSPLFGQVQSDLKNGVRQALPFNKDIGNNTDARVRVGDFYILGGQLAYVAVMGQQEKTPEGAPQARLRVIFGNGTESDLLLRSLQAALYKDTAGRRVTEPNAGPLFAKHDDADQ